MIQNKTTVKTTKMLLINVIGIKMSNIGSNQLTSVCSKIIRKPINPSRKEKKSLHFGHDHETKPGDYHKSRYIEHRSRGFDRSQYCIA